MLITGVTGFVGARLAALASEAGWAVTGTARTAGERADLRDRDAVRALVRRVRPDVVIHTAAGRDDWRAIADGAAHVAVAAAEAGARLLHVSSDAIFSGRSTVAYDESAVPDPVSFYGAAKAAAETAVRAISPDAAVVRASLVVGPGGQHETLTHDLIAGRAQGALFTDMIRQPVHVDDLAAALLEIAGSGLRGVLNVAGPAAISRYDLGVLVARRDGLDPARIPRSTIAASGARLPADVRLSTVRARSVLRTELRPVRDLF